MKKQDFKVLKTADLYPFPDNPFHVVEDEMLSEASVKSVDVGEGRHDFFILFIQSAAQFIEPCGDVFPLRFH